MLTPGLFIVIDIGVIVVVILLLLLIPVGVFGITLVVVFDLIFVVLTRLLI